MGCIRKKFQKKQREHPTILSAKKQININANKVSRNVDRINMLNASIEKTKTQTQVLNTYIDSVEEINSEAEAVLNQ